MGPSGVGKHTLVKEALHKHGNLFESKKSYTTRDKRQIEKNVENFYFVNKEEF